MLSPTRYYIALLLIALSAIVLSAGGISFSVNSRDVTFQSHTGAAEIDGGLNRDDCSGIGTQHRSRKVPGPEEWFGAAYPIAIKPWIFLNHVGAIHASGSPTASGRFLKALSSIRLLI